MICLAELPQVVDSRGNPTVEAELTTGSVLQGLQPICFQFRASVPFCGAVERLFKT